MSSSKNPLFMNNTLQKIFSHLDKKDLLVARQVAKQWRHVASLIIPKDALLNEFHLDANTLASLSSVNVVYRRFCRLLDKRKLPSSSEKNIYLLYCAGSKINEDFLHLLDINMKWFETYFANRSRFFIEFHFKQACVTGNIELVSYLVEKFHCKVESHHLLFAAGSGNLGLVKYLLPRLFVDERYKNELFEQAVLSGSVNLIKFLLTIFKWQPSEEIMRTAIYGGSYGMLKFLHETFGLTVSRFGAASLGHSRNLSVFQYCVEVIGWEPEDIRYPGQPNSIFNSTSKSEVVITGKAQITESAYKTGNLDIIQYIEAKFPTTTASYNLLLPEALKSGKVEVLKHLAERFHLSNQAIGEIMNEKNHFQVDAVHSGSVELMEFLVKECGVSFTRRDLISYAARAGNVNMVNYLVAHLHYPITDDLRMSGNLELISMIIAHNKSQQQELQPYQFMQLLDAPAKLILIPQLIEKKLIAPDQIPLDYVYSRYKWSRDQNDGEMYLLLMDYLIKEHQHTPTAEMLESLKIYESRHRVLSRQLPDVDHEQKRKGMKCTIM